MGLDAVHVGVIDGLHQVGLGIHRNIHQLFVERNGTDGGGSVFRDHARSGGHVSHGLAVSELFLLSV